MLGIRSVECIQRCGWRGAPFYKMNHLRIASNVSKQKKTKQKTKLTVLEDLSRAIYSCSNSTQQEKQVALELLSKQTAKASYRVGVVYRRF